MSDTTNPTALDLAVEILAAAGLTPVTAGLLARRIVAVARAEELQAAADHLMSKGHTIAALDLDSYIDGGAR
ncbi:hypothetical protein ACWGDE_01440 [Streptomyces sp. NPDC054956]